ncbi:MAG TPA: pitrilysin family protein [Pyrinomonadaceae bacterium]|nr:pitrilysin family protein [Pyrinomonadaceae bacterium]
MQWKNSVLVTLFAVLLLATSALKDAQAQGGMPQLKFRDRTLPNGLRLLSVEDHSSPTVAIQVWYHVGSKDDPAARSGFAHLFEHIMFKSTRNMKAEMMDRLTEDVGGFNNATTNDDVTIYFEVVPSNYLETLLWAEADRLSGLNVDDPNFKSERDVVKEEFRQGVLAPPYGLFFHMLQQKSFQEHPYKRPTIGSIEDLDAATLKDVQDFHATYYRPDDATLIVVGDFDQKELDAWVDKYFRPITKPDRPLPRVNIKEPPRKGEKRFTEYGQNVPLPAVGFTYLTPRQSDADSDALRVAEAILAAGESSRLYHALVYEQQVAAEVAADAELREDASLFVLFAILSADKKPEDAEKSLLAEIKRLQDTPPSAAELEKAKNQIITEQLRQRETSNGKALALGEAAVLLGDANRVNTDLSRLQAITAADVQKVLQKYLTDDNRMVLYYLPQNAKTEKSVAPAPEATTKEGR